MDENIIPEEPKSESTKDVEIKKAITCSFCHKGRHQVEQMVEGPIFNGANIYICDECVDITYRTLFVDLEQEPKKRREKIPSPSQIKKHLDEYIIGQDDAKISISVAVYNHFKRIRSKLKTEIDKSNMLMIGESGCGKTLTVKTIAKMLDIPCVIVDATTLTEAGYVGNDVDSLVTRLLQEADGDLEKAQQGIIFIDEIDKKSRRPSSSQRDVSGEGVQQSLLKLIEGSVIDIVDSYEETIQFDTKNVLFICSGAFVGLDEIISKDRSKSSMGIGANLLTKLRFSDTVRDVRPSDLIKYGIIPEFVGRHPIVVVFDDLNKEMMVKILKEPKNSLVSQFTALFKYEGVTLEFDDKYLHKVADECLKQKIGARGLRSIIERDLREIQFNLPTLAKEGVGKILVDGNGTIKHVYKAKKRATNGQIQGRK
jgi:ATP-dependent Clp protease ATP-binding subunit ClpX